MKIEAKWNLKRPKKATMLKNISTKNLSIRLVIYYKNAIFPPIHFNSLDAMSTAHRNESSLYLSSVHNHKQVDYNLWA